MFTTVQSSDGRSIDLVDLDQIAASQGLALATAAADVLIRSGMIRDDVALDGPNLLQFLSELGDWLASQRPSFVVNATYDGDGPSETLASFATHEAAVADVAQRVIEKAGTQGVTVTESQRETLLDSIRLKSGFAGASHRRTGGADEIALEPLRKAIGWTDSDIAEMAAPSENEDAGTDGTLILKGNMNSNGSKCGQRFLIVSVAEPYEHEVNVTVLAKSGQDDDALNDALYDFYAEEVTIKARMEDGRLICTSDDISLA